MQFVHPAATTPNTRPTTDSTLTAEHVTAAATKAWRDELGAVPGTIAYRAALRHGALLVPRGTSGETGDAWFYDQETGWMHDDGDNITAVDVKIEAGETIVVEIDVPGDVEILDWRHNSYRAKELNARYERMAEREYLKLADRAAARGQAGAFRAAVTALREEDPYALDEGLFARLLGADPAEAVPGGGCGDGYEDDEDRLSGR